MGLFDKAKLVETLNKAKDVAQEATKKVSEVANDKVEQMKKASEMKNMSREDALAIHREKFGNGDLVLTLEIENFEGPVAGEFRIKILDAMFRLQKGESLQLPLSVGECKIDISYSIVKSTVEHTFTENTKIYIGVDGATNTMKVKLFDDNGNVIEGSQNATKSDGISNFFKSATVTEDDTNAYSDADIRLFGENGQMYIYEDRIIIEREGAGAKSLYPFAKPITINMSDVDSVQIAESGPKGFGYIKVFLKGENGIKSALQPVETDKHAVKSPDNACIRKAKEYINSKIGR